MDGEAYHKCVLNPSPTQKWKKAEIQSWLIERGLLFESMAAKRQLLDPCHHNNPKPMYAAVEIATRFGHEVLYTPPYHLKLQPIDLSGNRIAQNPAQSMTELWTIIQAGVDRVAIKVWVGAFRNAQLVKRGVSQEALWRERRGAGTNIKLHRLQDIPIIITTVYII
ncbi:hypothetical protein PybrP1_007679 [[Pythium] brassicae (nom. inval.)]|nr:hypothetical protein PybrP1_007679 [[Pythium] brassicae (nom. inval.)]